MIYILKLTIAFADHMIIVHGYLSDEWAVSHRKKIKDILR